MSKNFISLDKLIIENLEIFHQHYFRKLPSVNKNLSRNKSKRENSEQVQQKRYMIHTESNKTCKLT